MVGLVQCGMLNSQGLIFKNSLETWAEGNEDTPEGLSQESLG